MDISIIILSYNTCDITKRCITSLLKTLSHSSNAHVKAEILIVDNASSDQSVPVLKKIVQQNPSVRLIENNQNSGFSKGNNIGLKHAQGRYVLFLNSDVIVGELNFSEILTLMENRATIGALTVDIRLPDGSYDEAAHRGFPTPWNALSYYTGLERLFGRTPVLNRIVGGYHMTWLSKDVHHEIAVPSGAFFLVKRPILDRLGGFDEDFFMYGEDIDLAYRISQIGYTIIFFPRYRVTHLKYSSGIGHQNDDTKKKIRAHYYDAMKIFFEKHYKTRYPRYITALIYRAIDYKRHRV